MNKRKIKYDVIIRDKRTNKIIFAKLIEAESESKAKNTVILSYKNILSRTNYNIIVNRLLFQKKARGYREIVDKYPERGNKFWKMRK